MALLKRTANIVLLLMLSNFVIMTEVLNLKPMFNIIIVTALGIYFIIFNINPVNEKETSKKLKIMNGGYELLISSVVFFSAEILIYLYIYLFHSIHINLELSIINAVVGLLMTLVLIWNGSIRVICTSSQLGLLVRILLLIALWIPFVNIVVLWKCCKTVHREYIFESAKNELNSIRKDSEICKTKYPILFVHGIFWRDWQLFNYWGRIPRELMRNGAIIYYGNQQSAAPMEISANELKNQILKIIDKEKCEKVNIIAHSKGGLDARYAISCLGMDKFVGSLTTVCTPHKGCGLVDLIFKKIPDKIIVSFAKKYNSTYKKLGDTNPDFYKGIFDLTTDSCLEFNKKVTDKESVIYQSASGKMTTMFSAGFPLNIGYAIMRHKEGENDGFVSVESSKWGKILGCCSAKGKRGVSHGDMIDLLRKNIHGFDVREFYVDTVKGLKAGNL